MDIIRYLLLIATIFAFVDLMLYTIRNEAVLGLLTSRFLGGLSLIISMAMTHILLHDLLGGFIT